MTGAIGKARAGVVAAATVGVGLAIVAAACAPNHNNGEAGPMAADTARGVIAVTGAEPMTDVTLRTTHGAMTLRGEAVDALRQASGVEVWVEGVRTDDGGLDVAAFRVRAVGDLEAYDGVLEVDGDAVVLVTAAGERLRFSPAPSRLRDQAGHHVWIAGPPGREPQSWGLLEPHPR